MRFLSERSCRSVMAGWLLDFADDFSSACKGSVPVSFGYVRMRTISTVEG